MKVQLHSDLHLEFLKHKWPEFIDTLDPSGVDVLVLAGDIHVGAGIKSALKRFCERYPTVVFVSGNHEMYHSSPAEHQEYLGEALQASSNLRVLDATSVIDVGGVKFAGGTLWFRDDPMNAVYQRMLNDFDLIEDFVPWVYEENHRTEHFLKGVLTGPLETMPDVVVTHHLPSERCVVPQYKGDVLNRFFVAPVADDIPEEFLPRFWCFGHTHGPNQFTVGSCRFLCNPKGYPHERVRGFSPKLVFEVEPRPTT